MSDSDAHAAREFFRRRSADPSEPVNRFTDRNVERAEEVVAEVEDDPVPSIFAAASIIVISARKMPEDARRAILGSVEVILRTTIASE